MRPRNVTFERDVTQHAARGIADPDALITHAEVRADRLSGEYVPDPMLVKAADHLREAREELADARNRIVWWLEENPDHPDVPRKLCALGLLARLYQDLQD